MVLKRSELCGVEKILITGTCLEDIEQAIHFLQAAENSNYLCTAGIHPTRCNDMIGKKEEYKTKLLEFYSNPHVAAIGEFGLGISKISSSPDF